MEPRRLRRAGVGDGGVRRRSSSARSLATAIGISSAYIGGAYDIVVQRVVDAWMSFPYLIIILSIMAVLGPGLLNLILRLAMLSPPPARG